MFMFTNDIFGFNVIFVVIGFYVEGYFTFAYILKEVLAALKKINKRF